MSSTNYKVQTDSLNIGGARSTSTNFVLEDSLGEIVSGEDTASTNFRACSGYQCFRGAPYISFSVKEGLASPGTTGAGVAFGTLSVSAVSTSNGSTINSIFIIAESNAGGGTIITVTDLNGGLKRTSSAATITSATATLTEGTAGYGICVFGTAQHAESPTALVRASPYNGSCTKTTGHAVGLVDTAKRPILSSTGALKSGNAEILVKAAISSASTVGNDYQDVLTFIATSTY